METGVVDGDAGVDREHLDQPLVVIGEWLPTRFVREVEVADRSALDDDRCAQERGHVRVVGREPVVGGVLRDVRGPDRPAVADHEAQQAVAPRDAPDLRAALRVDAARDEVLDAAARIAEAQRREPRPDQLPHAIDDQPQHAVDVQLGCDRARRSLERREALGPPMNLRPGPGRVQGKLDDPRDAVRGPCGRVEEELAEHRVSLV